MPTALKLFFPPTGMALAGFALFCLAPQAAMAQNVVAGTHVNVLATAPPSVLQGAIQDNTNTTAFQEQQDVTLTSALKVNITAPGLYDSVASLTPGTIAKGTEVNSFLFYSDPSAKKGETYTGSITFDSDILGVIVRLNTLDNSDGAVGALGTLYPSGSGTARGLELSPAQDFLTLGTDDRTLTYNFHTTGEVDEVRIITAPAAVPEASTTVSFGLLLALGMGGVAIAAKRKKQSA